MGATVPSGWVIIRRQPVSAVWGGYASSVTAVVAGVAGSAQPRATMGVPRRYPARGLWGGQSTPQPHVAGSIQPRATVPLPRRRGARGLWGGQSTPQPHLPGSIQPHPVIARRAPARGAWRGVISTTVNAAAQPPGIGVVQPRATVQPPRRYPARGAWRGVTVRTTNLPYGNQPGGLVKRRGPARAVVYGKPPRGSNATVPAGTAPRNLVVRHRRRARAYAQWIPVATTNAPPPPFTVGTLTATDTALATLTTADARGGASAGTLTATDQRTGGPA